MSISYPQDFTFILKFQKLFPKLLAKCACHCIQT